MPIGYTERRMDGRVCRVIDFASKDDMKRALRKLDGTELNGKRITLQSEVNRCGVVMLLFDVRLSSSTFVSVTCHVFLV